jgi:hypothetical protein
VSLLQQWFGKVPFLLLNTGLPRPFLANNKQGHFSHGQGVKKYHVIKILSSSR